MDNESEELIQIDDSDEIGMLSRVLMRPDSSHLN